MNVPWNVFRNGVALSACMALLAACQDRGQFQSRTYTPAEIEKYQEQQAQAKLAGVTTKPAAQSPTTAQAGGPTAPSTEKPVKPSAAPANSKPVKQVTGAGAPDGGAANKSFVEVVPSSAKFAEENAEKLASLDPDAVNIFKGITASVTGTAGNLVLGVDAQVQIGDDLRYLSVLSSPVTFSQDGKISKLAVVLKENDQQDAKQITMSDNDLSAYADCEDSNCSQIQVRIEIANDGGNSSMAVLVLKPIDKTQYGIVDSNLKDQLKSFEEVQANFKPKSVLNGTQPPAASAPAPGAKESAVGPATPAATTASGPATAAGPLKPLTLEGVNKAVNGPAPTPAPPAAATAKPSAPAAAASSAPATTTSTAAPPTAPSAPTTSSAPAATSTAPAASLTPASSAGVTSTLNLPALALPPVVQSLTAKSQTAPATFSDDVSLRKSQADASLIDKAMAAQTSATTATMATAPVVPVVAQKAAADAPAAVQTSGPVTTAASLQPLTLDNISKAINGADTNN